MIDVVFLVLPDTLLLDLAGPAEAFRLANQQLRRRGLPEAFRMRHVGPEAEVVSSVGLGLAQLEPLPARFEGPTWVVLLGRPGDAPKVIERQASWMTARQWLADTVAPRLAAPGQRAGEVRLLTVCVGALLAADAGLLAGRRVTTHHELLDDLAGIAPAAQVLGSRVLVDDGAVLTSAGVTTGIDLALHCIAGVCGDAIAAAVAQVMVVFTRRGPQAPQRSALLEHRDHLHPALHRVQDAVCADPARPWSGRELAGVAHVTERHLGRLFLAHVGLSPRDYVERIRVALARQALAQGTPEAQAATLAGFSTPRHLRQALARNLAAA